MKCVAMAWFCDLCSELLELTLVMKDSSRADTNTGAHSRPFVVADYGGAIADAAPLDEVAVASFAAVAYDRSNAVSDPMALALAD